MTPFPWGRPNAALLEESRDAASRTADERPAVKMRNACGLDCPFGILLRAASANHDVPGSGKERTMTTSLIRLTTLVAVLCISNSAARAGDESDPCASVQPAAAGGPVPHADEKLVVRWLGATQHETAYP